MNRSGLVEEEEFLRLCEFLKHTAFTVQVRKALNSHNTT